MKSILLFRHGKSDWNAPSGGDHERPINARGRKASRRMGRFLAEAGQVPDHVLVSSAVRARETLDAARDGDAWSDVTVEVNGALYEATTGAVFDAIRAAPDGARRLLLVGHEPTWSEMVRRFTTSGGSFGLKFPTAAIARIDVAVERWEDVAPGRGTLMWLVVPKILA